MEGAESAGAEVRAVFHDRLRGVGKCLALEVGRRGSKVHSDSERRSHSHITEVRE